ncbi:MAG: L,D-transpeptidase family protein [Zetaproteobacteria bacterium]|nr:L,D-transpeptidase family protein [Zetaproteobacteria bacterium]
MKAHGTFPIRTHLICLAWWAFAQPYAVVYGVEAVKAAANRGIVHLKIDKVKLQAKLEFLPSLEHPFQVVKEYPVAIGRGVGDKTREGDLKTPEGIYFTDVQLSTKHMNPKKYGPLAIPLNFPNPLDRAYGKTGSGIWLHGAGDDARMEKKQVTEGCVAFYNSDIVEVAPFVVPGSTVVSITTRPELVNVAVDRAAVAQATMDWLLHWQDRDISAYIGHYSEHFRFRGQGKLAYKAYKNSVFRRYKVMHVRMEDIRIITHPKYAISIMNQDFSGDRKYFSKGRKVLYWVRERGEWKILQEDFSRRKYQLLSRMDVLRLSHKEIASSAHSCTRGDDSCG